MPPADLVRQDKSYRVLQLVVEQLAFGEPLT